MVSWRPLNRKFKWLLAFLLAVKWSLAFHMRFAWLMDDAKWCLLMRNGDCWCEIRISDAKWWCENFLIESWQCKADAKIFTLRIGGAKIFVVRKGDAKFFALSLHWERAMQNFSHWVRIENGCCEIFRIEFTLRMADAKIFILAFWSCEVLYFPLFLTSPVLIIKNLI